MMKTTLLMKAVLDYFAIFFINDIFNFIHIFQLFPEVFLFATAHGVSLVMYGTIAALLSVAPLPSVATQLNQNLSAVQMRPGSSTPQYSSVISLYIIHANWFHLRAFL